LKKYNGLLWEIKHYFWNTIAKPARKTYWTKDGHLLPAGFDFEFKNVSKFLQQKYNKESEGWLIWDENGNCLLIKNTDFRPLSISSFRLTEKSKNGIKSLFPVLRKLFLGMEN
jgi:hypothetical protein